MDGRGNELANQDNDIPQLLRYEVGYCGQSPPVPLVVQKKKEKSCYY